MARQAKGFRDQFRQALPGKDPVSILAAVPLCVDDQIAIPGQARGETLQQPKAAGFVDGLGAKHIPAQADPAGGFVHVLPPRTARSTRPLGQFRSRNDATRSDLEILHVWDLSAAGVAPAKHRAATGPTPT